MSLGRAQNSTELLNQHQYRARDMGWDTDMRFRFIEDCRQVYPAPPDVQHSQRGGGWLLCLARGRKAVMPGHAPIGDFKPV
jgi:hypothetical protein